MSADQISLVGGHICLDFMNTVGDHLTEKPGDHLDHYDDFVAWARHAGVISAEDEASLKRLANQQPDAAEQAFLRAISLRETIFRLILSSIREQTPEAADLHTLNLALVEIPIRSEIIHDGDHYHWRVPSEVTSLDHALWRILWAAADLLTSDQMARVKICEGDGCGWVFLDTSRNQARRWCSMADCGNRAKAKSYYKRHKGD